MVESSWAAEGSPLNFTKAAAQKVYEQSGFGPENIDVLELHDCFSCNELITYEALGLCEEGKAGEFVDSGAQTYGGKVVVNPSGGLISKGHPLGATGGILIATLLGELERRDERYGLIAICMGYGMGIAALLDRDVS